MEFFYSASVMGYGFGRSWHECFNFYGFPRVTKTLTMNSKFGIPFAIIRFGNTIWNRVGLHNCGFNKWRARYNYFGLSNITVSIAGSFIDLDYMASCLDSMGVGGIELNFSCPNHKPFEYTDLPNSIKAPMYLKLNHKQDPYSFDLDKIKGIRVNSIPTVFGGLSGKAAQEKNWEFIKKFNRESLNVSGCSILEEEDIKRMEDIGCKDIGIGSVILTRPKFVEWIGENYGRGNQNGLIFENLES